MNKKMLNSVDEINLRLRKAAAIDGLMACKSDMPLQNGSIQELGEELCVHIQSAKAELERMQQQL